MFQLHFLILFLSLLLGNTTFATPTFKFHLMGETYTLDPTQIRGTSGSYLFNNIYRGLYIYGPNGLVPFGTRGCHWKSSFQLICPLKERFWSNGERIQGKHYLEAFKRFFDPKLKIAQSDIFINIKNAKAIMSGKKEISALGISLTHAKKQETLIFEFDNIDSDFLYKLAQPATAPIYSQIFPNRENANTLITNGPYKIEKWEKGQFLRLTPNPYYPRKSLKPRVNVQVVFVDDDDTALRLYESNKLDFLRRLPAHLISKYKTRKDFKQIPMARFDYIGFGPKLKNDPLLRKALTLSLNYNELGKILDALGTPGCPSLPRQYLKTLPCYKFDPIEAKKLLKQRTKSLGSIPSLIFQYSKMGGEDIKRQAEWFQNQWKTHLGLNIEIIGIEQGMLLQILQTKPGDLFRKGLALDRPTCLSSLETFLPGHPENYLQLHDAIYEKYVKSLISAKLEKEKKQICSKAIERLIDQSEFIPMGEIHFSVLLSNQWEGLFINNLNQLDLSELTLIDSK